MDKMRVIQGKIRNLKTEDSHVHSLKNLKTQAAGTAAIGALTASSTLATNAPIMIMAAKGREAKTFTGEIDDIRVIGQFTTVKFQTNDSLIFVISEEKEQGRHLVYATLDPKTGLLYMMYEMGRSLKKLYKSTIKAGFLFFLFFSVFFFIIFNVLVIIDDREFNINEYMSFIGIGGGMLFIFSFIVVFGYITIGNSLISLSKLSENIFETLGFENPKDQDFYKKNLLDRDGLHVSVMEYRKNLKGKDPYPEDYFDKK
ncbi:putative type VI secretion system effector [Acinetobacter sp. NIPH 298]|uniref:putative type VI secretion system effector n=1 Tax=Acinetobacter sp. NIPH 298 TaxID=1217692 RepID=UPI0002D0B427|nr:putative type VI secretion system effector [Acinetobacter sp. NIPH 298]ENW94501.1 hypothetical protein F903_02714 [Acinetobacter sp. NIPH 298]